MEGFSVALGLPDAPTGLAQDARSAIREEQRSASKWKKLRCHEVRKHSSARDGCIYIVDAGQDGCEIEGQFQCSNMGGICEQLPSGFDPRPR